MADVLVAALSLVTIIGLGFGVKQVGWVKAGDFRTLSTIVLRITLPALLVTSFNNATIETDLLLLPLVALAAVVVQQVTGFLLERRNGHDAQAFGVINMGNYNIGLFAVPYLAGFLGPQVVVYASMFDIGNALAAAGIGYAWAMSLANPERKATVGGFLQEMATSPPFVTYLLMVTMRLLDLSFPDPVIAFTSTIGAANTFLAMFMLGVGLEVRIRADKYRTAAKYLMVRYAFGVVLALLVWFLLPLADEIRAVLCMLLFAPLGGLAPAFTGAAGGDVELSALTASVSTLMSLALMPLVLLVLTG